MEMNSELDEILSKSFADDISIKPIYYNGLFVPDTYYTIADSVENFQVRDDDIWVCSFPKTGTTWTQEMVWNIANNLNFDAARKVRIDERFPFIEFTGTTTTGWVSIKRPTEYNFPDLIAKSVDYASNIPSPRFLKTHLPYHILPHQLRTGKKKSKIIYVTRNPKDACISYYYHYKLLEGYIGTFENFCKFFLADKVYYAPYWNHVLGYWEKKGDENILLIKYEDMKTDLPSVIRKTANFLGKSLNDEQVKSLEEHLSFYNMKENPTVNRHTSVDSINKKKIFGKNFTAEGEFIRKGETGQWKTTMSENIIKQFDDWSANKLLNFKFQEDFLSYK